MSALLLVIGLCSVWGFSALVLAVEYIRAVPLDDHELPISSPVLEEDPCD